MKTLIIVCLLVLPITAHGKRLPRHLKTPKTCKVIKVSGVGVDKTYSLKCDKPLSKRMRGWVMIDKNRFGKHQDREWMSRRGNWRMLEESVCRLKTCKAKKIVVFKIVGC